jgi:hypothetical protein
MCFQQLRALKKALKVLLKLAAPEFRWFKSIRVKEIDDLVLPCESGEVLKICIPEIVALGLLHQKSAGTAPIAE